MPGRPFSEPTATFRFDPDQWLWCLHCHRFFQGREARPDRVGGMQSCAFADCDGAGFGVDLLAWDDWPRQNPDLRASWPVRSDLRTGLVLDPWSADPDETDDDDGAPSPRTPARPAPNRDLHRLDALLGAISLDPVGDLTPFRGLDGPSLAALLDEGFALPDLPYDGGPTATECLAFLRQWPQAWAQGHVVAPTRADYGVVLTGIECSVRRVPRDDRPALRAAFVQRFGLVGALYCDPVELTAWWG